MNPVDFGWTHDNDAKLVLVMLEKAPVPPYLYPQESCKCTTGCKNKRCTCVKAGKLCKYCSCTQCTNLGQTSSATEEISEAGSSTDYEGRDLEEIMSSDQFDDDDSGSEYIVGSSFELED